MPLNKFADVRYRVIDQCLREKHTYYTIYDLAKKCDEAIYKIDEIDRPPISIRQIKYDLNYMQSDAGYQAEIESLKMPNSKKHYFRYADPNFSISNRPLSVDDLTHLKSSLHILQKISGLHHDDWVKEFEARIENLDKRKFITQSNPNKTTLIPIILFDNQDLDGGSKWIMPLFRGIEKKLTLKITYQEFDSPSPNIFHVSPYLLKQYNRRWFLLCYTQEKNISTLPLDRIQEIEPSSVEYVPYPNGDNPSNFFDDIIGVINDQNTPKENIILEVHEKLLPYLESKVLHEDQRKSRPSAKPNWHIIELRIKPNYEFYSVILSHGPRIKVLNPPTVVNKMRSLTQQMSNLYE